MKSFKFFKPAPATTLAIGSWRLILLLATAVSLIGYPNPGSAATFNVWVGASHPLIGYFFSPSSVTIHPGDQVTWTWASSGHSTTSGRPGMPTDIWDSGVRSQGATFTHTFNSVGTFPYYCKVPPYNEVGQVIVTTATPTPTPTPPPVTGPPVAITDPATLLASFSVKLNGSVNPHGLTTSVYFQYATTNSYGLTTAPQSHSGNTSQDVSAHISGLTASTTYHFRIVTTNGAGTRYGSDTIFTTLPPMGFPIVTTRPATNVASFAATLNGVLDPHGLVTSVSFQYGTTAGYGRTTAVQSQTGNTFRNIAASIGGLAANTTYHSRIVATNSVGTRYGSDRTFTTQ